MGVWEGVQVMVGISERNLHLSHPVTEIPDCNRTRMARTTLNQAGGTRGCPAFDVSMPGLRLIYLPAGGLL